MSRLYAESEMCDTYSESFWGGNVSSCAGYEALVKRNSDSKKMIQEMEDYLKKRSKLEAEYSKSLQNLTKSFRLREEIGVLEKALNKFRSEIDTVAQCHSTAAAFFQQLSDGVKRFKEEQVNQRKSLEDQLQKSQSVKLSLLSKAVQMEKNYVRKFTERDAAEQSFREMNTQQLPSKEIEKAKSKFVKAEEDADKAESAYKNAVNVLENSRTAWERDMTSVCQSIQTLDEKRLNYLRQQLWVTVNMNSTLALDLDNSSESVREILEKCDIVSDIQAFIQKARTGNRHPEPFVFRHYMEILTPGNDNSNTYCTIEELKIAENVPATSTVSKSGIALPTFLRK